MAIIQSIPQLETLRGAWTSLAETTRFALTRHEWFASAAHTLLGSNRLCVVTHTRGGRLEAAAALVRVQSGPVERLEFLGANRLHEPAGFLYRDEKALRHLIEDLLELKIPLALQRIWATGAAAHAMAKPHGVALSKRSSPCLGIDFDAAGLAWLSALPRKLRHDLKRARTRAELRGPVSFEVVAPAPGAVDGWVDTLVAVEGSGWKRRHGSALAVQPAMQAFFRMLAHRSSAAGTLRFFALRVGNTIAAAQVALEVYDRLWILKIGYDESYARCSPGVLLTAETIAHAARAGLAGYEFLGSAEPWEARWHGSARETSLLRFYPWTVRGCVGASADALASAWRRTHSAVLLRRVTC